MDWIKDTLLKKFGNISEKDLDLFSIVDTEKEVIDVIDAFYKKYSLSPNF